MTDELAEALWACEKPFHDITCAFDNLKESVLLPCYSAAVKCLHKLSPDAVYWQCQDWDWHDGYITLREPLKAEEWLSWLESSEALREAWRAEDQCHRTVYPANMSWCLRFHLWETQDEEGNEFDISGSHELVEKVKKAVFAVQAVETEIDESEAWFFRSGFTAGVEEWIIEG